jgi:hypothetical protein
VGPVGNESQGMSARSNKTKEKEREENHKRLQKRYTATTKQQLLLLLEPAEYQPRGR